MEAKMPETAAIGDLFQVTLEGELEGQLTANVWHFKCIGTADDVDLRLILVFINCFITNLLPVLTHNYTLTGARWKRVAPTLGVEHFHAAPAASVGGKSGDSLPSYASALLSMRTTLGGRSHRGRKYIAGIPETETTGSFINVEPGDLWAGLLAFAACVIAAFVHPDPAGGTNIFNVGVYSRKLGGAAFPYGAAGFTSIESITPVRDLATTRSRKIGSGR